MTYIDGHNNQFGIISERGLFDVQIDMSATVLVMAHLGILAKKINSLQNSLYKILLILLSVI